MITGSPQRAVVGQESTEHNRTLVIISQVCLLATVDRWRPLARHRVLYNLPIQCGCFSSLKDWDQIRAGCKIIFG